METLVLGVFIVGYILITMEHPIKINKTATALLTGVLCWTLFTLLSVPEEALENDGFQSFLETLRHEDPSTIGHTLKQIHQLWITSELSHHLSEIAQILFFLMGAMTIVELVDAHHGFRIITDRIHSGKPASLAWTIGLVTFFLSALLDNLTTTIVMISLTRKLLPKGELRLMFAGLIVIAANAGGAWSPIGDVTTTMLWIGGQISASQIISDTFLASLVSLLVPLVILTIRFRKEPMIETDREHTAEQNTHGRIMLISGVCALLFVPVFKTVTHLPPFMGMLLALGAVWIVSELVNPEADERAREPYSAALALQRIDMSSVLFFLGILLAVGSLQANATLPALAGWLDRSLGNIPVIVTLIGFLSAVIDNVPLVAASMGMYSLADFPPDHLLWQYMAYCAGTGGSMLVIGSAAGVAAMGMEQISFFWYVKRISLPALAGYLAGALVYLVQQQLA